MTVLDEAQAIVNIFNDRVLPEGELRMAMANWRLHQKAHHHSPKRGRPRRPSTDCDKCVSTSERVLHAGESALK